MWQEGRSYASSNPGIVRQSEPAAPGLRVTSDGSGTTSPTSNGARVPQSSTREWTVRRLMAADAAAYHALRLEGFSLHPLQFRVAPEDEMDESILAVGDNLERTFVAGGFADNSLVGIAGLTRFSGAKLRHRALLWGMYVSKQARGSGLADELMRTLLAEAQALDVRQVVLTVASENERARRFYGRWGFSAYGMEPGAIRIAEGYLDEVLMIRRLD